MMDEQSSVSPVFDFEAVFQVDDYLNFYGDSLTEIRDLLRLAVLEIEQVLGDWDGQSISPDSGRMIIIARTYGEHE